MATAAVGHTVRSESEAVHHHLTGWAVFGSVILLVVGGLNLINGYTALQHSGYYHSQIVYSNMTFWGWAFLIWGALELVAGALVLAGKMAGNYMGVILAATAAILWFFMIFAAPFAALLGVTVSLLVIGGFTAGMHPDDEYY